jgi:aspartate kinase
MLASTGEQVSVGLLAIALQALGKQAVSYAGWQVPIKTDSAFTKARIRSIDDAKVRKDLNAGKVVIITGFQGVDADGNITTLGRGGSDTSAVAVAAAIKAAECLIYTDVDGVYTTDPRVVSDARRLKTVTFEEMLEMASLGSKVLQIRFGGIRRQLQDADPRAVVADRPAHAAGRRSRLRHPDFV